MPLRSRILFSVNTDYRIAGNPLSAKHRQNTYLCIYLCIKKLLSAVGKDVPSLKQRILSAIISPDRYNLYDRYEIFDKFGNAVNRKQT